jgi:outer membrane protein TolC
MNFYQALLGGVLVFTGCVRFHPQPLSPAQTAAKFEARSLTNPNLAAFLRTNGVVPGRAWTLRDLTYVAFYYQPDLALARAQWETARAGEVTAGERPNPTVSLTPGYDGQIPGAPSPWIVPITFDLPIETAGKRGRRIEQSQHLSDSAYWKFIGAIWQVRSGVRSALSAYEVAERTRVLLTDQAAAQSNVVRLLQGQLSAGAVSGFDLTQARVALDTDQISLEEANGQVIQARAQLAGALGLPASALAAVEFANEDFEKMPMNLARPEVREQALLGRADVRSALADYAASQSALQLAIAGQYPDVHLGPGYAWNTGSAGDNEWQLGLSVTLPFLNQNKGAIGEAEAKRRELAAAFLSVQAKAISQIDGAIASYHAAVEELQTAAALAARVEQRLKLVHSMANSGDVDPLAVANAEVEFSAGAMARLNSLARAQQALAQVEDAVQSPLTLPEQTMQTAEARHDP